jgi:hypothetical protein
MGRDDCSRRFRMKDEDRFDPSPSNASSEFLTLFDTLGANCSTESVICFTTKLWIFRGFDVSEEVIGDSHFWLLSDLVELLTGVRLLVMTLTCNVVLVNIIVRLHIILKPLDVIERLAWVFYGNPRISPKKFEMAAEQVTISVLVGD